MSELSQPKKPSAVSDEDTVQEAAPAALLADSAPVAGSVAVSPSKAGAAGSGRARLEVDVDKTDPDQPAVASVDRDKVDVEKTEKTKKPAASVAAKPAAAKGAKPAPAGAKAVTPTPAKATPTPAKAAPATKAAASPTPVKSAATSPAPKPVAATPVPVPVPVSPPPSPAAPELEITTVDATAEDIPASTRAVLAEEEVVAPAAPGPIVVRVFGRTDVGQVREHNEDNFVVADLTKASRGLMEHDRVQTVGERGTVLGVCDGMGGAAAGEVASQLAVDIVYQRMLGGEPPKTRDDLASRLVMAIEAAGMRIFADAKADRSRRGMGTTATVAALIDDHLFFGQVGDSRGYLLRGDRLVQVTRDQSLVNQLIEAGQLTEEEAETFEHNNIILQALGTADSVQVDLTYVELKRGDTLLLCSDGLSGMVRNDEIREVLRSFDEPLEVCRELTDRANLAGGHDNVTVVVAKFEGEGLNVPSPEEVAGLKYRKYELPELSGRGGEVSSGPGIRTSMRPSRPAGTHGVTPDIEVGYDEYDPEYADSDAFRNEDPVELPREQAPSWIVTMMIVSAVTCVVVAGYYLLR